MLDLDYEDIERQPIFDLYSQIIQTKYWSGWGIYKTLLFFEELVTAFFQILGGISLSVSLFAAKVPKGSELEPINHPLFAVGILMLLLLIAVLSPICKTMGDKYMTNYAKEARLGNRFFYFFGFMSHDKKERQTFVCINNRKISVILEWRNVPCSAHIPISQNLPWDLWDFCTHFHKVCLLF